MEITCDKCGNWDQAWTGSDGLYGEDCVHPCDRIGN